MHCINVLILLQLTLSLGIKKASPSFLILPSFQRDDNYIPSSPYSLQLHLHQGYHFFLLLSVSSSFILYGTVFITLSHALHIYFLSNLYAYYPVRSCFLLYCSAELVFSCLESALVPLHHLPGFCIKQYCRNLIYAEAMYTAAGSPTG